MLELAPTARDNRRRDLRNLAFAFYWQPIGPTLVTLLVTNSVEVLSFGLASSKAKTPGQKGSSYRLCKLDPVARGRKDAGSFNLRRL